MTRDMVAVRERDRNRNGEMSTNGDDWNIRKQSSHVVEVRAGTPSAHLEKRVVTCPYR